MVPFKFPLVPILDVVIYPPLSLVDAVVVQKSSDHNLACMKPCKQWDELPISTGYIAGFLNHQPPYFSY